MSREPRTKDLATVIAALELTIEELKYQVARLTRDVNADTATEGEHLRDIREGYKSSAHFVGILCKYHKGRLRRAGKASAVDDNGRSAAFHE